MRFITVEDLKISGYDSNGISNYKLVDGRCCKCGENFEYSSVKKFLRNRKSKPEYIELWETCQRCWLKLQTSENSEWIEKNRAAQFIAQNKPEQKIKNAIGVSKSWTDKRKEEASKYLKDRIKNDVGFAAKAALNIAIFNALPKEVRMKKSFGIGGLRGSYRGINYDSALELSFIFWCEGNNVSIKRYDLDPIKYLDKDGTERAYIPDFIIGDNIIVEVKGRGVHFNRNYERNIQKIEAAKKWVKKNGYTYRYIDDTNEELKKNYRKARRYHYADYKEELF